MIPTLRVRERSFGLTTSTTAVCTRTVLLKSVYSVEGWTVDGVLVNAGGSGFKGVLGG